MAVEVYQVDAFADGPFTGNPAAVCPLEEPADPGWMQQVAMENNLSETAFCWPEGDTLRLRWFTPTAEVDLCGHATLATSHILWETGRLAADAPARFTSKSGPLGAIRHQGLIELDFPARRVTPIRSTGALEAVLGVHASFVGSDGVSAFLAVDSEDRVREVQPDFRQFRAIGVRSAILTAESQEDDVDFVSRFFAPGVGIDEDPVTGSAHCSLSTYWADRLGREQLVGYQASARGGRVQVRLAGDRVHIGGRAVTVIRGELLV